MTNEQLRDEILSDLTNFINYEDYIIVKDILNKHLQNVDVVSKTELTVEDETNLYYIKMFCNLKLAKASKNTARVYLTTLKNFMNFIGNRSLLSVTSIDIECYLAKLRRTNNEVSVNNYRRNLSAFYSWLVIKHFITFNPCVEIEPYKEIKKVVDYLEYEEVEALKEVCDLRERALLEFWRCTASRVGETITVKISDIDFSNGDLLLYGEKTREYRYVFLDRVALGYIKQYINARGLSEYSDEILFANSKDGTQLTTSGISKIVNNLQKKSKLKRHIYPHLFRKTVATNIIKRGGTNDEAGIILGHKAMGVTARNYIRTDKTTVRRIFDCRVAMA